MNQLFIKPDIIKKAKFIEIDCNNKKSKYYLKDKLTLENQFTAEEIKKIIKTSSLTNIYIKQMQDFDTNILYKSKGHGINHNIRVGFFAYIISTNKEISKQDFTLIMEACKYHDIGRENDLEDKEFEKVATKNKIQDIERCKKNA